MCYSCRTSCKSYAEMTEFPKIYSCYWGSFRMCGAKMNLDENDIFKNRNEFAKVHQLAQKPVCNRDIEKIKQAFKMDDRLKYDHMECYKTKDNYIVVVISPYMNKNCEDYFDLIKEQWTLIDNLYSTSAITFMLKFTKEELNKEICIQKREEQIRYRV